jgi:hypothetical protein
MLLDGMHSLFITSFRSKGGYMTRIAGAVKDHIGNTIILQTNSSILPPEDKGYILMLKVIYENHTNYKKDTYHANSAFQVINRQAHQFGKDVEIRRTENPQNN